MAECTWTAWKSSSADQTDFYGGDGEEIGTKVPQDGGIWERVHGGASPRRTEQLQRLHAPQSAAMKLLTLVYLTARVQVLERVGVVWRRFSCECKWET